MALLFELLFEFFGEILLQIVLEALAEVGLRWARQPSGAKASNPSLAALGYALLGAGAGALSLWIFPALFMQSDVARVANLIVTPFVGGGAMALLGAWRRRRDQPLALIDRFAYGYVFALGMAAVRFAFGR